jgi:hypothetical protein
MRMLKLKPPFRRQGAADQGSCRVGLSPHILLKASLHPSFTVVGVPHETCIASLVGDVTTTLSLGRYGRVDDVHMPLSVPASVTCANPEGTLALEMLK